MKVKVSKIVRYILSLGIAALFIWLVVRKVDWASFMDGLRSTSRACIALFTLASLLALVFRAFRWNLLLKPLGSRNSILDIWDSINVGNLANIALPGAGEVLRTGFVARRNPPFDKAFGTIFMERLWDVLAIGLLIVTALALKWSDFGPFVQENIIGKASVSSGFMLWAAAALILAGAVLVYLCFRFDGRYDLCTRTVRALKGVLAGAGSFFRMKGKPAFVFHTFMVWMMYILMSWFGLKAIPELSSLSFADALFISAIGNLASVIPVPSGMGPYHYLVSLALTSLYGCSAETGLLFAVLCHETHAVIIIVIGIVSYIRFTVSGETKKPVS